MNDELPIIYVARHGETAWSLTGQHTGLTDLPLTKHGEQNARGLATRLEGLTFAKVFTSPLQRAVRTCELAGFRSVAEIDPDLVEWDYGEYEGLRSVDILKKRPDWNLFRDGAAGRRIARASCRAGRPRNKSRASDRWQRAAFFQRTFHSSAGRLAGSRIESMIDSRRFMLTTASLSALGYEESRSRPVIRFWNDTHHVAA